MKTSINPSDLSDELHIDQTPVEIKTLTQLISYSESIILDSFASDKEQDFRSSSDAVLFDAAVQSLATAMYYDRSLDSIPYPTRLIITHLQAKNY